jgi:hypothetical protein
MMFVKSSLLVASAVAVSNEEWEAWKQEHGRVFNGADEDAYRRSVFEENLAEAASCRSKTPWQNSAPPSSATGHGRRSRSD